MEKKFQIPECESCEVRVKSVFKDLHSKDLDKISLSKGCNIYKKGQTIFYEGTRPTGLYCINQGKIKLFKLGDEGREQIVRLAKEGDILGYRALISNEPYTATAESLDDACICFIPRSGFFELIQENHELSLKMMQVLSTDLRSAEHKITDLAQKPVRERLAEALLTLIETYGYETDEATLTVTLTREELANIVGTATETIIRLLSEFKKDNIISLGGRKIKILDHRKLTHTANLFD